jgi:DNA-binding transcriptional regulator YdaS (Cro superfamily)
MARRRGRPIPPEMQQALDAAGGAAALAELLKLSPQRVARWRTIPTEYAIEIEAKLGLARERARPDRTFTQRPR